MMNDKDLKELLTKAPFSATFPWLLNWMNKKLAKLPPKSIFLEMGTFVGGSTSIIATANPHLIIHTIDINEFSPDDPMIHHLKSKYKLPDLSVNDLYKIQDFHLEDLPNVIRHTGDSKSLDIGNFDAFFVDASHHTSDTLNDLEYAWNHSVDGALIFGDDVDYHGPFNAFSIFSKMKDVELTLYSKGALIQKNNPEYHKPRWAPPNTNITDYDIVIMPDNSNKPINYEEPK